MSSPESSSSSHLHGRSRHGSVMGQIPGPDIMSPALSTMPTTRRSRALSDARIVALRTESRSDSDIAKKIAIAFRELTYRHTWIIPLWILLASYSLYFLSDPNSLSHRVLKKFVVPSYKIPGTDQYGKGRNDFFFVAYYAIFFTFLREFMMICVFRPIAKSVGIKNEGKIKRFMEQCYAIFYYGISGPLGLWIMHGLPLWWFETTPFYLDYPHYTHDFWFKIYYLGQASFWSQQALVMILQLEKPRKDYQALVLHHIVTIALIWCSYRFHFTWMGLEVFLTMDISDFFFAIAKTSNYLDSEFTGPIFVFFVISWIYLRHWVNLRILWSILTEFRTVGAWELNWVTQQYKCYISQPIVFFLLGTLQLINLYWLYLILRILWRFVQGSAAKDDRSDDEEESEGETDDESSEEETKKSR
ncbi:acyl-CoA-dependent ceramide synthase [Scheffersomyces xylosifermentans]|uniref:acyl-CoA-dependent ceramide synthase n=1 Tax=Scheffersomyces xylosifermentans TaxID=1304137 RepID=UPI00315CBD15